jgi:hypothetical protein
MSETRCPACNSTPCYISFFGKIECGSLKCQHYSKELYPQQEPVENKSKQDDEDPQKVMFFWSTYHTDCGD